MRGIEKRLFSRKKSMWSPTFRIAKIRISNVGVIDDITLRFESAGATCIYAGNGVGKTTILECISLLGHLPCFPTYDENNAFSTSALARLASVKANEPNYYSSNFRLANLKADGSEGWANSIRPNFGCNYGLVEFEVEDNVDGAQCRNHLFMLVHERALTGDRQPKITGILSRGSFDRKGKDDVNSFPTPEDIDLADFGLAISHSKDQSGQSVQELIHKIALGRTFLFPKTRSGSPHKHFRDKISKSFPNIEPRSVAYLNTDLNDFGRGNDLRESPKDLENDFGQEMFERLRVEQTAGGVLKHLKKLSDACDFVLNSPHADSAEERIVWPSFDLKIVRVSSDRFDLSINRKDGLSSSPITFLSAGENEVFFVFLVLLNLACNDFQGQSIVLLDEPDLHIALSSRSKFFAQIFELCRGDYGENHRNLQLIACSHSPSFFDTLTAHYKEARKACLIVARQMTSRPRRAPIEIPKTRLISFYDELYLQQMEGRTSHSSFFQMIKHKISTKAIYHYCRTRDAIPWSFDVSAIIFLTSAILAFFTLLYFGLGKIVNDKFEDTEDRTSVIGRFFLQGESEIDFHEFSNPYFFNSLYVLTTMFIFILLARLFKRWKRTVEIKRFKERV